MLRHSLLVLALTVPAFAASPLVQAPVAPEVAGAAASPATAPLSPWRISAGFVWRSLGNLHFSSDARARGFALPVFDTRNAGPAGSATGRGGHTYDDGYVYSDISGPSSADTWFWGYQDAGQLSGNDLAFHGTATAYSQRTAALEHPGWSSDMAGGGPLLSASWSGIEFKPGLRLGAEFSASLIQADEGRSINTLRVERQVRNQPITDHYTVDPLAIPGAPFPGDFNGPGPIIPSFPSSRDIDGPGTARTTTLSLGPTMSCERGRLSATAGLGFALNIASWEADKTDSLYRSSSGGRTDLLARWHSQASGTDVLPGFYLQTAVTYAINATWSVQAFGRYDWSRALEGRVGGSTFHLDLSGWSIGAGVVYRF